MSVVGEDHLSRVRRICSALPGTEERLSHGEPTFFVNKRVYAALSNNHHNDGHVAVLLPAARGVQELLTSQFPKKFYRPPYVGPAGWIGVELDQVSDDELREHIATAWRLISEKKRSKTRKP